KNNNAISNELTTMAKVAPNSDENQSQLVLIRFQVKKQRYANPNTRQPLRFKCDRRTLRSAISRGTKPIKSNRGTPQVGQPKDSNNPERSASKLFLIVLNGNQR